MDNMDRRILDAIQSYPDLAITDLAQRVGLSHTPCWRRLKRLEKEGVIQGRIAVLDPQKLDLGITVLAHIRLRHHDEATLEKFEQQARDRPEIVECFSMSGESDYSLRIVVGSIDDYERLLKKVLLHLSGLDSIKSNFALKCIKLTTKLPILPQARL